MRVAKKTKRNGCQVVVTGYDSGHPNKGIFKLIFSGIKIMLLLFNLFCLFL